MEQDRLGNRKLKIIKHPSLFSSPPMRQKLIKLKSMRLEKTSVPYTTSRVSTRQKTIQKLESVILLVKTIRKAELLIMEVPFQLILKRSNGQQFQSLLNPICSSSISKTITTLLSYSRSIPKLSISRPDSISLLPQTRPVRRCLITREFSYTLIPARLPNSPASNLDLNFQLSNQKCQKSPSTSLIFPVLMSPQSTHSPKNRSICRFSQEIEDNFNVPNLEHSENTWGYWGNTDESSQVNYENHVNYFNSLESVDNSVKLDSVYKSNHLKPSFPIKHHQNLQSFDLPNMSSFESLPISIHYEEGQTVSHNLQFPEEDLKITQYGQEDLVEFAEIQDLDEINEIPNISPSISYENQTSQDFNTIKSESSKDSKHKNARYAVLSSRDTLVYESIEKNVIKSNWNKKLPKCYSQFFEEDSGQVEVSFKDYEEKISTCVSLQSNFSNKPLEKIQRNERELKVTGFESLKKNMKARKYLYKGLEILSRLFFIKIQESFLLLP